MTELNTVLKDPSTGLSDNSDKTKQFKLLWNNARSVLSPLFKEYCLRYSTKKLDKFSNVVERKYSEVLEINDCLYRICSEMNKSIKNGYQILISCNSNLPNESSISITTGRRLKRIITLKFYGVGFPLDIECEGMIPCPIFNKSDLEGVLNEMIKSDAVTSKINNWITTQDNREKVRISKIYESYDTIGRETEVWLPEAKVTDSEIKEVLNHFCKHLSMQAILNGNQFSIEQNNEIPDELLLVVEYLNQNARKETLVKFKTQNGTYPVTVECGSFRPKAATNKDMLEIIIYGAMMNASLISQAINAAR